MFRLLPIPAARAGALVALLLLAPARLALAHTDMVSVGEIERAGGEIRFTLHVNLVDLVLVFPQLRDEREQYREPTERTVRLHQREIETYFLERVTMADATGPLPTRVAALDVEYYELDESTRVPMTVRLVLAAPSADPADEVTLHYDAFAEVAAPHFLSLQVHAAGQIDEISLTGLSTLRFTFAGKPARVEAPADLILGRAVMACSGNALSLRLALPVNTLYRVVNEYETLANGADGLTLADIRSRIDEFSGWISALVVALGPAGPAAPTVDDARLLSRPETGCDLPLEAEFDIRYQSTAPLTRCEFRYDLLQRQPPDHRLALRAATAKGWVGGYVERDLFYRVDFLEGRFEPLPQGPTFKLWPVEPETTIKSSGPGAKSTFVFDDASAPSADGAPASPPRGAADDHAAPRAGVATGGRREPLAAFEAFRDALGGAAVAVFVLAALLSCARVRDAALTFAAMGAGGAGAAAGAVWLGAFRAGVGGGLLAGAAGVAPRLGALLAVSAIYLACENLWGAARRRGPRRSGSAGAARRDVGRPFLVFLFSMPPGAVAAARVAAGAAPDPAAAAGMALGWLGWSAAAAIVTVAVCGALGQRFCGWTGREARAVLSAGAAIGGVLAFLAAVG
ncbi:MAG: hypothetical protein HY719_05865 [Planctomycetes bacterium]|nr:hypothetical protein [Planctomycetota bacterium]